MDANVGSLLNPFSEGGIFDGHTIADIIYKNKYPGEIQSGEGGQLSEEQIRVLATSQPNPVPLDDSFNTPSGEGWIDKIISNLPLYIIGGITIYMVAPKIVESIIRGFTSPRSV